MGTKEKRIRCVSGGGIRCSIHCLTAIFVLVSVYALFFQGRKNKIVLEVEINPNQTKPSLESQSVLENDTNPNQTKLSLEFHSVIEVEMNPWPNQTVLAVEINPNQTKPSFESQSMLEIKTNPSQAKPSLESQSVLAVETNPNKTKLSLESQSVLEVETSPSQPKPNLESLSVLEVEKGGNCNFFDGKWVYDNSSSNHPLYKGAECSFMDDGMACEKFGRKNLNYQHWRWQPLHCDLPRFNAQAMLEMLRGKRLVFVGDSINRNQWVSMVCLVEASIPLAQKSVKYELNDSLVTFKATWLINDYCVHMNVIKEYNASIDFYWAPLLVESNCDDPRKHRNQERVVRIHAIEKHARHWTNADILVFDSYLWWRWHQLEVERGSVESLDEVHEGLEHERIYEMALKTWSDWLESHVNRTKTKLFFVSMSPIHNRAEEWGKHADQNCYNETDPISTEGYWGSNSDPKMMQIVEKSILELGEKGLEVKILNITQLSEYRRDAHTSIYRKHWNPPTKEQLAKPETYADCIHWCLPGVPDVWNELLYAHL